MALLSENEWRFGFAIYVVIIIALFTAAIYAFFSYFPFMLYLIKFGFNLIYWAFTTAEYLIVIIIYSVSRIFDITFGLEESKDEKSSYWN